MSCNCVGGSFGSSGSRAPSVSASAVTGSPVRLAGPANSIVPASLSDNSSRRGTEGMPDRWKTSATSSTIATASCQRRATRRSTNRATVRGVSSSEVSVQVIVHTELMRWSGTRRHHCPLKRRMPRAIRTVQRSPANRGLTGQRVGGRVGNSPRGVTFGAPSFRLVTWATTCSSVNRLTDCGRRPSGPNKKSDHYSHL